MPEGLIVPYLERADDDGRCYFFRYLHGWFFCTLHLNLYVVRPRHVTLFPCISRSLLVSYFYLVDTLHSTFPISDWSNNITKHVAGPPFRMLSRPATTMVHSVYVSSKKVIFHQPSPGNHLITNGGGGKRRRWRRLLLLHGSLACSHATQNVSISWGFFCASFG